jgi:outer membrane protein, heavy metal efflux system
MFARTYVYALALVVGVGTSAAAQENPLSLSQALAIARERAPAVIAARARIVEAQAAFAGASMRLDNPELDANGGSRFTDSANRQFDFGVGLSQMFENGKRRQARIDAATEAIASAEAHAIGAQREVLREASVAFLDAHYLQRHDALLLDAIKIASEAERIAERRFALGDVAALDLNTARVERARLEAERQVIDAQRLAALGSLGQLLGMSSVPSVAEIVTQADPPALADLLKAVDKRPELRVIDADIRQAEARVRLAAASKQPVFGASARYERDEGDHLLLGGLTITLPTFNKGQDIHAEASARIASLRAERAALANAWALQVRSRLLVLDAQRRALAVIDRDALPAALDNEGLARRGYEIGQISVIDWIVLRREAMQVRREQLDRLRDIAIASVELDAVAGVIQ